MNENIIYHRKCVHCKESFFLRYFDRHDCKGTHFLSDSHESEGEENIPAEFLTEQNNFCDNDFAPMQNDDADHSSDEELPEDSFNDLFDDLLQQACLSDSFFEETIFGSNLIIWLSLFIAFWQKTFNITDTAVEFLLKFIFLFMQLQSKEPWDIEQRKMFSSKIPGSLHSLRKFLSIDKTCFKTYVVCIKCHNLYDRKDCEQKFGARKYSKKCSNIRFPDHPQKHLRKECGQSLLKTITLPSGEDLLVPFKTYCYKSVTESLKLLIEKPGFEENCEKWRDIQSEDGILMDIHDGAIWKSFSVKDGEYFFQTPRNYACILNVDWFQPFKHLSSFSVGGIYIVLLNLPRHLRFLQENVLLVGIIPNMAREPPTNTFLYPLVEELEALSVRGFKTNSLVSGAEECFRLALLCVGCDIPASRKLCGFLGHSAAKGCSKCNKIFPGRIGERDYSGFNVETWVPRATSEHRMQMQEILSAKTLQDQTSLESQFGTRFSVLAYLSYFDTVKMTVIDPMHNLFLGTAKHLLKIWKNKGFLNRNSLESIQDKVDQFIVPHDIGKIPRKIISSFDGFTADEYKNWVLLFALVSIDGIIPKPDIECFRKFALACQFLCKRIISKNDIITSHQPLLNFCKSFESLYGKDKVTPNMHLHLHLKDCLFDFGPIYGFWLFSFERYNGILGKLPNNKKNIESQLMQRFCTENSIVNFEKPLDYSNAFEELLTKMGSVFTQRGTLNDMSGINLKQFAKCSSRFTDPVSLPWYEYSHLVKPLKKMTVLQLSSLQHSYLKDLYQYLYPMFNVEDFLVPLSCEKYTDILISDDKYTSMASQTTRSSYVLAFWCGCNGLILKFNEMGLKPRPGKVRYFIKHNLFIGERSFEHWFAYCEWFLPVEETLKNKFGKPVEVWNRSLFEQAGPSSFIPVLRFQAKFVLAPHKYMSRDLMVVVPRIKYSFF